MNETWLFLAVFLISAASVFFVAKIMKKKGILSKDINKQKEVMLPKTTGVALLIPLWLGIIFLAFIMQETTKDFLIVALAVTGFSVIGLLDDLKKKFKGGLTWQQRAIPVALFSIAFAFLFSPSPWIAPLLAIYIAGLAGLENTFAGLNGWEVGSGFIISLFTIFLLSSTQFFLPAIVFSASILGLLFWNFYPAKVFPGDSGTLLIGGTIACLMVLAGNILLMLIVFMFFLPHLIDYFLLKLRTNKGDTSQKKFLPYALEKGKISIPKYSDKKERLDFAKLVVKIFGPMKEWKVVAIIWAIVFLNCLFWFFAYHLVLQAFF